MGLGPPLCRVCYEVDSVRAGVYRAGDVAYCLRCRRVIPKDEEYLGAWTLPPGDAMAYHAATEDYASPAQSTHGEPIGRCGENPATDRLPWRDPQAPA